MKIEFVNSPNAPSPGSHYAHASKVGNLLIVGQQIPKDIATKKVPPSVKKQTILGLKYLSEILQTAGTSLENVLFCKVYMTDLNEFDEMMEEFVKFFPNHTPARSTIQVAGLLRGSKVSIELMLKPTCKKTRLQANPPEADKPVSYAPIGLKFQSRRKR